AGRGDPAAHLPRRHAPHPRAQACRSPRVVADRSARPGGRAARRAPRRGGRLRASARQGWAPDWRPAVAASRGRGARGAARGVRIAQWGRACRELRLRRLAVRPADARARRHARGRESRREVVADGRPARDWVRVMPSLSGICGSDLAAISGHVSLYLDPLTSYPFIPGHEVVGVLDDGARVVIEPALGCLVRGVDPPCPRCAEGRPGLCYNVTEGPIEVGLQTGYCADTGGGWGETLVAQPSQVHPVPDSLTGEAAVVI